MRIGIIGAENSHATKYATTINNENKFPGVKVVSIWGETDEFAEKTAKAGNIPTIVKTPEEMIGKVDAIIIDHRSGSAHLPAARKFIDSKIPLFIDKPLCCDAKEAKEFLELCQKQNIPVNSFSSVPMQKKFLEFKKNLAECGKLYSLTIMGPADMASPYNGLFFYGIHHIEACQNIMGLELENIKVIKNEENCFGVLSYSQNRTAILHMIKNAKNKNFSIAASTDKGSQHVELESDENPYLTSMTKFITMFQTKKTDINIDQVVQSVYIAQTLNS